MKTDTIKRAIEKETNVKGWKRISKRKFEYNNISLDDGTLLNGKLNWRAFHSDDGDEPVFVIDNGNEILYLGVYPNLSGSLFNVSLYPMDGMFSCYAFFLSLKDEEAFDSKLEIFNDNIHEATVAGFENEFKDDELDIFYKNGYEIFGEMENVFSVIPSDDNPKLLKSYDEFEKDIFKIFNQFGFTYSIEDENDFYEEHSTQKKDVIKELNALSIEDLNDVLRGEYEESDDFDD